MKNNIDTKLDFIDSFFEKLNQHNINYIVLAKHRNINIKLFHNTDIDILIDKEDYTFSIKILKQIENKYKLQIIGKYEDKLRNYHRILSINNNKPWGLAIDIFNNGLCYKGVEWVTFGLLSSFKEIREGIWYLNKDVYEFLRNRKYLICKLDYTISNQKEIKFKSFFLGTEFDYLLGDRKTIFKKIGYNFPKRVLYDSQQIIKKLKYLKSESFSILCEDNNFKSLIMENVKPILNDCFNKSVIIYKQDPNIANRLFPNIAPKKSDCSNLIRKTWNYFYNFVKINYYFIICIMEYYLHIKIKLLMIPSIGIIDCNFYDLFINPGRFGLKEFNFYLKTLVFILPKPKKIIYFQKSYKESSNKSEKNLVNQKNVLFKKYYYLHKKGLISHFFKYKDVGESVIDLLKILK